MSNYSIERIEYKGHTIDIAYDQYATNPLSDDEGRAKFCCLSHGLMNDTPVHSSKFSGWDAIERHLRKSYNILEILPIYLYDHSGITIDTEPFSCSWDSGQVGFIFIDMGVIRRMGFKSKRGFLKVYEDPAQFLQNQIKLYDSYLRGECYGFSIENEDGDCIDSSIGWIGDDGYKAAIAEAKSIIDNQ